VLDEIIEKEIPEEPENQNVQQKEQQVPQTPASVVRISIRLSRPPKRYSSSLYYLNNQTRNMVQLPEGKKNYIINGFTS
jgi:hypothetical protein